MKLICNGFKETGEDSFDHIYFFKATLGERECFFELTNEQIARLTDSAEILPLPAPFDFGMHEPSIVCMLRFLHTAYWRDEDGCLEGAAVELTKQTKPVDADGIPL